MKNIKLINGNSFKQCMNEYYFLKKSITAALNTFGFSEGK